LIQQIQQETGIQDPQEAAQYAQQAIALMDEHSNNNPQGLHSVFRRFLGGGLKNIYKCLSDKIIKINFIDISFLFFIVLQTLRIYILNKYFKK
jgi:hypothetical protein